jgi:ArsR family transcriptional regulator, arsenate/arsenite/antimonite-responsive transcriptional repressor
MAVVDQLESLFQALGDRTRLRLLNLLASGEICVCFLVEVLGEPQPKISRHLAYLRREGLVAARRDGKWIHYRLAEPSSPLVESVMEAVTSALCCEATMQRDRAALGRACCNVPKALRDAPLPVFVEP